MCCPKDVYVFEDETTDEDSHRDPDEKSFPTLAEMTVKSEEQILICNVKLPI